MVGTGIIINIHVRLLVYNYKQLFLQYEKSNMNQGNELEYDIEQAYEQLDNDGNLDQDIQRNAEENSRGFRIRKGQGKLCGAGIGLMLGYVIPFLISAGLSISKQNEAFTEIASTYNCCVDTLCQGVN